MIPLSRICKGSGSRRLTWSPSKAAPVAAACIAALTFIAGNQVRAEAPDANGWYRYENDYFVAYSNAGNWQARKILEDLEYFRAAALRVPDVDMPRYVDKTLVVIPATESEYAALAENENAIGFAQPLTDRTAIVFPATSRTDKSKYVLHHEYAHALAHGNFSDYPQWYMEGFAEIASSVVIHKRRMSFYVGMHEGRWNEVLEPVFDWDELISDDFDAHGFTDVRKTASAYAQFWLIAHYLTMSGSEDKLRALESYFSRVENGEASVEAFRGAFGMSANELWETELEDYLWRIPEYRHSFSQSSIDRSFDRTPADPEEIAPMLRFFTDKASMARGMDATSNPMAFLTGKWDHLKFTDQCTDLLTLRLASDADELVMDDFYVAADGTKRPATFKVNHVYGSELILTNQTDVRDTGIAATPNYQLSIRGEDVLCFDEVPARMLCQRVLHRCDD